MTIGVLSGAKVNVPGLGSFSPGALIKMLKTDENTKILSSPHILTSNNEEAVITVGEKVFFPSAETNATTGVAIPKVEKEDVNLSLNIKPNISNSNYVTMKIQIDASSLAGVDAKTNIPRVNTRKTNQVVTARNGQTIVISGLVSHREVESFRKIPLLGDIPIIGWLFRNSSINNAESNLVIFLTPHVVHGPDDLAAIYKSKVNERDEFLTSVYGSSGKEDRFYARLPTQADGEYHPTPVDDAEQRRLDALRDATFKEMGYGDDEEKADNGAANGAFPGTGDRVMTVPVAPSDGGGGSPAVGGSSGDSGEVPEISDAPPAPPQQAQPSGVPAGDEGE
jgi:general secretion pathway protein D